LRAFAEFESWFFFKPAKDDFRFMNFEVIAMAATVVSLPPNNITETVDFVRRLASMMAGGRNADMLVQAAAMIDALARRAMAAEQLFHQLQDESARNVEQRQVAEIATDKLTTEVDALKAQLAESAWGAETERTRFTEEARRLQALAEDADARLARANAELAELRVSFAALGDSVVVAPVETLRLARTQFDHLAEAFARSGDVTSQTICEIGGCAIDQAIGSETPSKRA
jgi:hypothetical protein